MRELQFTRLIITLAAVSVLALTACSNTATKTAALETAPPAFPFEQQELPNPTNFSGSYLAGRFALRQQDWNAAQNYLNTVLAHDVDNMRLREKTFLLTLGAGNYDRAVDLARGLDKDSDVSEIAHCFLAAFTLKNGDAEAALRIASAMPGHEGFSLYTKPILTAWALAALGRKDEALATLAPEGQEDDATYNLHAGMIEELGGDLPAAAEHYVKTMENGLTLHSSVIVGNFFTRIGRPEVSDMIHKGLIQMYPFNPFITALGHQDKNRLVAPAVSSPADGVAIAMYDLSSMLYEQHAYDSAQIYASVSQMMRPGNAFVNLLRADIAALRDQHARAVDLYNSVPQDSPLYWLARMRVAEVYEINNRVDLAAGLLEELTRNAETRVNAYVALGDLYRRHEQFAPAVTAYDGALAAIGPVTADQWQIVYARGMALERLNEWPQAEKDLLQALSFQPDNPQILNYIGYSWVDKGVNMDQALDFLRRAVAMQPDDGYILDSYGWAFYRTGHYADAVKWIEQAVSLVPDDEVILDHLGDSYWQIGRHNEARFKWRRALQLSSDTVFQESLKAKIINGPPAVPAPTLRRHGEKEAKL